MEMLKAYYSKAKSQSLLTIAFTVALVTVLFLPFLKFSLFGSSYNFSFDDMSGLGNLLVVLGTIVVLGGNAYIVYSAKNGVVKKKVSMMIMLGSVIVSALSALLVLGITMYRKEDELSFAYGFFLAVAAYVAALAVSGYAVYKDKNFAKEVIEDVQSEVKSKVDAQKKDKPESK